MIIPQLPFPLNRSVIVCEDGGYLRGVMEQLCKSYLGKCVLLPRCFSGNSFWEYISPYSFVESENIRHLIYEIVSKYVQNKNYLDFYSVVQQIFSDIVLLNIKNIDVLNCEEAFVEKNNITFTLFKKIYRDLYDKLKEMEVGYKEFLLQEILSSDHYSEEFLKNIDHVYVIQPFSFSELEQEVIKKISREKKLTFLWDDGYDFLHNSWNTASDMYTKLKKEKFWQINEVLHKKQLNAKIKIVSDEGIYCQLEIVAREINRSICENTKIAVVIEESELIEPLISKLDDLEQINIAHQYPVKQTKAYSLIVSLMDFYIGNRDLSSDFIQRDTIENLVLEMNNFYNDFTKFNVSNKYKESAYVPRQDVDMLEGIIDNIYLQKCVISFALRSLSVIEKDLGLKKTTSLEARAFLSILERLELWHRSTGDQKNDLLMKKLLLKQLDTSKVTYKNKGDVVFISNLESFQYANYDKVVLVNLTEEKYTNEETSFYFLDKENDNTKKDAIVSQKLLKIIYCASQIILTKSKNASTHKVILQLQNQFPEKFTHEDVVQSIKWDSSSAIQIEKHHDDATINFLKSITDADPDKRKKISPSMINTYLDCSLKFYFLYVKKLQKKEKRDTTEKMLGVHLHEALYRLYSDLSKKGNLSKDDFQHLNRKIEVIVEKIFQDYYIKEGTPIKELDGEQTILRKIVEKATKKIVEHDAKKAEHIEIMHLEKKFARAISILSKEGKNMEVTFGGKIDRIEKSLEEIRIIDYKTGIVSRKFTSIADLFSEGNVSRRSEILQILLYTWLLGESSFFHVQKVSPHIFGLRDFYKGKFDTDILMKNSEGKDNSIDNFGNFLPELEQNLRTTISEILNRETIFRQTLNRDICARCLFQRICE